MGPAQVEAVTPGLGKEAARSSGKGLPQAYPGSLVEQQDEQCDWSRNGQKGRSGKGKGEGGEGREGEKGRIWGQLVNSSCKPQLVLWISLQT